MYTTHRTAGSVIPVAVRHVSPKSPISCDVDRFVETGDWRARDSRDTVRERRERQYMVFSYYQ